MDSLALVFTAGMIATVVLLALGMLVGYQLGLRARIVPIVVAAPESNPPLATSRFEPWIDAAEILEQRSRGIIEIAARYRESAPPELLMAIDQLVAVVTKLGQRLQHTSQPTRAGGASDSSVQPAGTLVSDNTAPSANVEALSPKEMSDFTGFFNKASSAKRRYPYDCFQTLFPIIDSLPETARAIGVRCHDISVHGISFFLSDDPDFERLVISLGHAANPVFMEAEVVKSKSVYMHNDMRTLVGCQFTGRHVPQNPLPLESPKNLCPALL